MHAVIRILCLLIAAGFLARGGWADVVLMAVPVTVFLARPGSAHWQRFFDVLRRLRFLLLSMAIIFGWFTPGEPLWPRLEMVSPTVAGLEQALLRVASLVVLVGCVRLLIETGDRAEFIAGVRWWARPLRLFGVPPERLALRLVLAMEAVPRLREVASAHRVRQQALPPIARIGAFASGVFAETLAAAERAPLPVVSVPDAGNPRWLQWLLPAVLAGLLWVV